MKKILSTVLIIAIIFSGCALCESSRADDTVVFAAAVDLLKQMDSRESVEDALSMFKGIASNYNQSKSFCIYTSAVLDIYDEAYDDAEAKLAILEMDSGFIALLQNYSLQSCEVLEKYIQASRLEMSGDVIGAFQIYTTINFKDALEKSIALIGQIYADAMQAFNSGDYERAAQAFEVLGNYKDSAEMAEKAAALIPTLTPKPTPTPTPTPTPVPVPKKQTGEISDSWEQIIAAIDDGTAKQRYAVGTTKELDLGELGTVHMQLAGFDLDERADGNGMATTTWIAVELLPIEQPMKREWGNSGGWRDSDLRAWLQTSVMQAVPETVRKRLIPVYKKQMAYEEGVQQQLTEDDIWIPDRDEVFGEESLYYDLFLDNDQNRVKKRRGSAAYWWLRSANTNISFMTVSSLGYEYYEYNDDTDGVALGFCL